jgi:hypothetical protein
VKHRLTPIFGDRLKILLFAYKIEIELKRANTRDKNVSNNQFSIIDLENLIIFEQIVQYLICIINLILIWILLEKSLINIEKLI